MTAAEEIAKFLELINVFDERLRIAFEEAIADLTSSAELTRLANFIQEGNFAGVLAALHLEAEFFNAIYVGIREAFDAGGNLGAKALPTLRDLENALVVIRFNGRHSRAESWVQTHGAKLVTGIVEETKASVREIVNEGLRVGRHPRKVALDIVGRMDGRVRVGGILGLTVQQTEAVIRARQELGDLSTMKEYLQREARDKRFDPAVRLAMERKKPLSPDLIDRAMDRYSSRLLKLRGETIARTEALAALNAGRYEAAMQMIESGQVPAAAVTKIWDATPSKRTRDSHRLMDGQEVKWGEFFKSPITGALLNHPHDQSMGAPADEVINCRCTFRVRVDRRMMRV